MKFLWLHLLVVAPSLVFGSLDAEIKAKGKTYFGTAADPNTMNTTIERTILASEFGAYTPENSMKWESTELTRGNFTFDDADTLVAFAEKHHHLVRGHTLVWHSQLPAWVSEITSAGELASVIVKHITTLVRRYKGKLYAWDVVNEVIDDNGEFRDSVFYNLLGEKFIDLAFHAARAADPHVKLYLNDYNLDLPGAKLNNTIALINRLKSRGVPIDGVGTQSHLIAGQVSEFRSQLKILADKTKLDIAITELDIRILLPLTNDLLVQQQEDYNTVASACIEEKRCKGITVWGVSDKNSWVLNTFPEFGAPLIFDDDFKKKLAYFGVEAAFK